MKEKPIVSVLRNMKIGDVEVWSSDRGCSVKSSIHNHMPEQKKAGWKFATKTDYLGGVIIVTRIQ